MGAKLDEEGTKMLAHFEGTVNTAYYDVAGIQTVCTGHVVLPQDRSWMSDGVTAEECLLVLKQDVSRFERCVDRALPGVKLNQKMINALISLAYNIGEAAFEASTVVKRLRAGDYSGAAVAIMMWQFARVKLKDGTYEKRPVLAGRRTSERALFLAGVAEMERDKANDLSVSPDAYYQARLNMEKAYEYFRMGLSFGEHEPQEHGDEHLEDYKQVCLPPDEEIRVVGV